MINCVIIDSGLGGLSLLKVFYNKLPINNYIYFADTKNLPYGLKTKKELFEITKNNINFIIKKYNPSFIVFGCNTLGVSIFNDISNYFPNIKFFSVFPNLSYAIGNKNKKILILATSKTINILKNNLDYLNNKDCIILCKMPKLASLVEKNIQNTQNIVPYLKSKLKKYKDIDCIVLGCTHYYFVKEELQSIFNSAEIVDGVSILADTILQYLSNLNLNITSKKQKDIKLVVTSDKTNVENYKKIIKDFCK